MTCTDCHILIKRPWKIYDGLLMCDQCFHDRLRIRFGFAQPGLPCPYKRPAPRERNIPVVNEFVGPS